MPEFEEPETNSSSKQDYTPSTDASNKPRTRRRSGGFKTEYTPPSTGIGVVDAADALKSEKLSGGSKPEPARRKESSAPAARKPEPVAASTSKADPSPETLAAIQRVEARLAERKKERDAKRAEREKNRPAKSEKKSGAKQKPSSKKKQQSGGLLASILSIFGLGAKPPAKKKGGGKGKSSGNRGKGGNRGGQGQNHRGGKGGNRSGQGQNRRGGKGRRGGGGGGGQRRNNNRSQD